MQVLGYIGTAVGLVLFLGAVAVFLAGSRDKGTIESLQRSNAALETELAITNSKCAALETRVKALETENEVLLASVSHSEEIRQLQADVNQLKADVAEMLVLLRGVKA